MLATGAVRLARVGADAVANVRPRRILRILLTVAGALVLLGPVARAATYYVNDASTGEPGSVCTAVGNNSNDGQTPATPKRDIQNLLDAYPAMGAGDSLWADPGTYTENIEIGSGHSGLTLQGAGAGVSVIDGGGVASCIRLEGFASGEISGFTIQNGYAFGSWPEDAGGGIYCHTSSPTIQNNTISGNLASDYGGGICCWSASSPTIQGNIISGNSAEEGGGIYCEYHPSPTIQNNTISGNSADYGGGICCYDDSSPTIQDNTVSGNSAQFGGGGIDCYESSPTIQNNTINGNSAEETGGGICCEYSPSPTIQNNTITGNSAHDGAGIHCLESSPTIRSNTLSGNLADNDGGGICCDSASSAVITNSILWGNSAASGNEIALRSAAYPSSLAASYSDAEGGQAAAYVEAGCTLTWGAGNVDTDPLFADEGHWDGDVWVEGDYHLKSWQGRFDPSLGLPASDPAAWVQDDVTSPCIDDGDPSDPPGDEPLPDGDRINMGGYGGTDQASKSLCPVAHGVMSVGGDWTWVSLPAGFTNPVVVAGPASRNDVEPGVLRLRSVQPNGFAIRFQEWDYLDGSHATEKVHWVAVDSGVYNLSGGKKMVAAKFWTNKTNPNAPRRVTLPVMFAKWPVVLAQVQTNQGTAAVTDRIVKVFSGMFAMVMQEEEAGGTHGGEQIGYIAVSQGTTSIGGVSCDVKRSWIKLKHQPVWVGTSLGGKRVFVEEEESADAETEHWLAEYGGFLGLGGQLPYVADLQTCWADVASQDTSVLRCYGTASLALGMAGPDGAPISGQVLVVIADRGEAPQAIITSREPVTLPCDCGAKTLLEAPGSIVLGGDEALVFSHWLVDGEAMPEGQTIIELKVLDRHTAAALYEPTAQ